MCTLTYFIVHMRHFLSSNKKSTIVGFMYKHVPYNDDFTFFVSRTLTSSTFRFWIDDDDDDDDDDGTIDCINHSTSTRLMIRFSRSMRQDYAIASIMADRISMRCGSHDDLDIQELVIINVNA